MSDLPGEALDYQVVVAEYFLALRGAGLMLSPLDQEVVADWERRGLPVAVVCRGLRRGVDGAAERGGERPRSLRALRLAVEDEWRAYRAGLVGDAPPPPGEEAAAEARLARARAVLAAAGRGAPGERRAAYREAWRALARAAGGAGSPLARVEAALADADAQLVLSWLAALPASERRGLGPRIRLLAGPRDAAASPRAYRDALRAHLSDLAAAAGLTRLRGSV